MVRPTDEKTMAIGKTVTCSSQPEGTGLNTLNHVGKDEGDSGAGKSRRKMWVRAFTGFSQGKRGRQDESLALTGLNNFIGLQGAGTALRCLTPQPWGD